MRFILFYLALFFSSLSVAVAQVNNDAFRNYFLVGQFGEVCTMCEVIVLCEATVEPLNYDVIPVEGDFNLYYIQTRTFWSQISTIWEWFSANFQSDALASRGHVRPVWVYEIEDSHWRGPEEIDGRLILEPGIIELGKFSIDRLAAVWQQDGSPIGYCKRMDLWQSIDIIGSNVNEASK
jgi:hypothetical protein